MTNSYSSVSTSIISGSTLIFSHYLLNILKNCFGSLLSRDLLTKILDSLSVIVEETYLTDFDKCNNSTGLMFIPCLCLKSQQLKAFKAPIIIKFEGKSYIWTPNRFRNV